MIEGGARLADRQFDTLMVCDGVGRLFGGTFPSPVQLERLELITGQLVVREPQGRPHSTGIRLVAGTLRAAFGPDWNVEAQLPVALDEDSEPEPDVVVVAGGPRDYLASHPTRPVLVSKLLSRASPWIAEKKPAEELHRAGSELVAAPRPVASPPHQLGQHRHQHTIGRRIAPHSTSRL